MNIDTAIITRLLSGIAAGVIIALQGVNVGQNEKLDHQIGQRSLGIIDLGQWRSPRRGGRTF